jgi:hypothetical protein
MFIPGWSGFAVTSCLRLGRYLVASPGAYSAPGTTGGTASAH